MFILWWKALLTIAAQNEAIYRVFTIGGLELDPKDPVALYKLA